MLILNQENKKGYGFFSRPSATTLLELGQLMESIVRCRILRILVLCTITTRAIFPSYLWQYLMQTWSSYILMLESQDLEMMLQYGMAVISKRHYNLAGSIFPEFLKTPSPIIYWGMMLSEWLRIFWSLTPETPQTWQIHKRCSIIAFLGGVEWWKMLLVWWWVWLHQRHKKILINKCLSAADIKMEIPVPMVSLKLSIFSSTSLQMDKTF